MTWLRLTIAILALLEAGWMTFDGTRALTRGDYVTPRTGPRAGQLGPWARVVAAAGVAPRATGTKVAFVTYGAVWLAAVAAFLAGAAWAERALLLLAIGAVWYAPLGTLLSVAQVALLGWLRRAA